MAPLLFGLTLFFSQLINYTHSNENQSLYEHLKLKCPNISKNAMVEECSSTKVTELFNISDSNVHNVLCTVHLYNMWKFINYSHTCDELSKHENYNSRICEKPEFLIINQTDKLNQIDSVKFICEKLCINWSQTINLHCSSAKYYYDQFNKLHKPSITPDSSNNTSLNAHLNKTGNYTNGNEPKASVDLNTKVLIKNAQNKLKSEKKNNETISGMQNGKEDLGNKASYEVINDTKQEKVKEDSGKEISAAVKLKKEDINKNLDVNKLNAQLPPSVPNDKIVSEGRKDVSNKIESTTKLLEKNIDESNAIKNQFAENEDDGVPYIQEDDEESTGK